MSYKQENPFCIQIELTTGCNLQCTFCGINGFQDKPNSNLKFMTVELAEKLANQIKDSKWNSRLEFAMHGEPTMNPNWMEIIKVFRETLPKHHIMMTSNGGGLLKGKSPQENIEAFFLSGGDKLAIDEYESVNFVKKIKSKLDEFNLDEMGVTVYDYPEDKRGNPHKRSKDKFLSFIAPINLSTAGTHADLNNHCGSGGELEPDFNGRCAKPFREISVNSDGSINLCCNDFIGEYTCGNVNNTPIDEIWNNEYFNSARKFLMVPDRSAIRPCRGCNAKSTRVGLLPDKFGKMEMELPTESDYEICSDALFGGPDRAPTKRAVENIIPILTIEEKDNW